VYDNSSLNIALGKIEKRVFSAFRKENLFLLSKNALEFLFLFLILLFAAVVFESVFEFNMRIRTVISYTYAAGFAVTGLSVLTAYFMRTSAGKFNSVNYSLKIGKFFPAVKDRIANAISLYKKEKENVYASSSLIELNLIKTQEETSGIDLGSFIDLSRVKKHAMVFFSSLIILSSVIFFVKPLGEAFYRLVNFRTAFGQDKSFLAGQNDGQDDMLKKFTVTISYPSFTNLPDKTLDENNGDVFCLEGSKLAFKLEATENLSAAGIDYEGVYTGFGINGANAEGSVAADKSGNYKFILKSENGRENTGRKTYNIRILKDEPPKIVIKEPKDINYTVYGDKEILVKSLITDDFGFSKLVLHYRKPAGTSSASGMFAALNIPVENPNATSLEVPYLWQLSGIGKNGTIEYYVEVTDNSGKTAKSETRYLIFNSPAEYFKKNETKSKELKSDINTVLEDIKSVQQKIDELKKMNENNAVNEQRKHELQNKVENLQKNMDNVQNKIDQSVQDLKQNNISDKTLEQFMKLQELFGKINTPEFREMLKKLQEALKKNNEQMKQDLSNMKFDEEAFMKQMEQVMELMKRIENLQKFGELTQKLDELAKQQEALKKETENTPKENEGRMNTLADKQKSIEEDFRNVKEGLKELSDKMKNTKNEVSTKDIDELQKKMNQRKTQDKMQKSSSELFKGQKQQSEQTQEEITEDLKEFNEDMQNALESAMSNMDMNNKMADKLKQIKKNIEEISEKEKDLKSETNKLDKSDKEDFQDLSQEQGEIKQDLTGEINDLMGMTQQGLQVSPELGKELGNAYNKMEKSKGNLSDGDKNNAMSNQGKAIESLDNAAKMLGDMLDKMGKQKGKGSKSEGRMGELMQQLAQIIAQQQGVNGKMNKMGQNGKVGKDGKGGEEELSQIQKEQMDRLRMEQEQIQKSLEQLNAEFEIEKQKSGEKVLGNMDEVKKDMEESVRQMSKYEYDAKLLERQNRILSRMLDAQLSQREKEYEQKRESKPGNDVTRMSPKEVVISGPRTVNSLQEELLRFEKAGFSEDYENLIIEYNKIIEKK
jgi:hypothetical protein